MSELPFTGERFIPGTRGEIWIEHWHRYHFAARWVKGKRVLDLACGEGYGSALLARHAESITGVDVSQQAIDHAQRAYGKLRNARFAWSTACCDTSTPTTAAARRARSALP
jgi:2-polyprenyl-3-methyl-5-hydroxy-6-metoxy-1,4-benzoquinol methylase